MIVVYIGNLFNVWFVIVYVFWFGICCNKMLLVGFELVLIVNCNDIYYRNDYFNIRYDLKLCK